MMSFYSTGFSGGWGGGFSGHPGGSAGSFNGHPAGSSWGAYQDAKRRAAEARRRAEAERRARHAERARRAAAARDATVNTWGQRVGAIPQQLEEFRNAGPSEATLRADYFSTFRANFDEVTQELNGNRGIEDLRRQINEIESGAEEARLERDYHRENVITHETAMAAYQEVRSLVAAANEMLPQVSAQMEQAASDYVRQQLETSQTVARQAVRLAGQGTSRVTVQLFSDFARDTASSVNAFLGGVASGFYDGLVTPLQAARAIYNHAELITHLSNHIVHVISEGPRAVTHQVGIVFQHIADAVYQFEIAMAFGTSEQRGHALGEFGANVVLGMAGGELAAGARAALDGIAANLAEAGANEALGAAVNQGLRAAEQLAPEMAAVERRAAQAAATTARDSITIGRDPNQIYHAFRHTDRLGLDRSVVQEAVLSDLRRVASEIVPHNPAREIIVNGIRVRYSPHRLPDGTINVGLNRLFILHPKGFKEEKERGPARPLDSDFVFHDKDGSAVSACLYLDQEGEIFELDLWKMDNDTPLNEIPEVLENP